MGSWKKNAWWNGLIKLGAALLLGAVIYQQVIGHDDAVLIWRVFVRKLPQLDIVWLVLAVVLMPVNWAMEALKWVQFVREFEAIGFWKAYKAIFAGVLLSVFTPNRIGEYAGRILWIRPENQWKAVISTLVSSYSQILVTFIAGLAGIIYVIRRFADPGFYWEGLIVFSYLLLIGLMLVGFFNIDLIIPLLKRVPAPRLLNKLLKHLSVLTHFTSKELTGVLGIAFLRYCTYTLQYYCMLHFFDIDPPPGAGLACIAAIFLLQTSLPLPPIVGMFTRGEVALFIWSAFSSDKVGILAATFSLWTVNVLVPALVGLVFLFNVNILKSFGYDGSGH